MAYNAPSTRSTGDLCTAAIWNADVVANAIAINAGALALASQAVGDILYASSTTQLGRIAAVATGQVLTSAGTGTVPAWSSNVDLGGTLDVTGATTLDGTLGVVGAVTFNDAGADVDFRVESDDNQNMLFVDGGEDRVGIGTGSPVQTLHIDRTNGAYLLLSRISTGISFTDGTTLGHIQWGGQDADSNWEPVAAQIVVEASGAWTSSSHPTEIQIQTTQANSVDLTTVMTIGDDGKVTIPGDGSGGMVMAANGSLLLPSGSNMGIGTSSPDTLLHVFAGDAGSHAVDINSDVVFESDGGMIVSTKTGSGEAAAYMFATPNHALDGGMFYTHNATATSSRIDFSAGQEIGLVVYGTTNVAVQGALSKGSGSFNIAHPLMPDTHRLVYSFIEGPKCDLIYRGTVALVDGTASIDLDEAAGMSSGTWILLCRDEQVFSTNETGWFHVRGSVAGSTLTIDCEEATCTDTVSWMVVASRKDSHIMDTDWTDDDGYPIIEPLKVAPDPEPEP